MSYLALFPSPLVLHSQVDEEVAAAPPQKKYKPRQAHSSVSQSLFWMSLETLVFLESPVRRWARGPSCTPVCLVTLCVWIVWT